MVTDFVDIGARINKAIDLNKLNSKEEYFKEVDRVLDSWTKPNDKRPQSLKPFKEEIYEVSEASTVISRKERLEDEELKAKAIRFERSRERLSRIRDESHTARDTRPITLRNYKVWRRGGYSRMDLMNIDTKRSTRPMGVRATRRVSITGADRRLVNARVYIDVRRNLKQYRDLQGKYTRIPFKRKK
jgi:hypothetical protein